MQRISHDEMRGLIDTGAVILVEALPEPHSAAEQLPGAVNLPGDLTAEPAARLAPDPAATAVTYCAGQSRSRSKVAATAFDRLGYRDVPVYEGGKTDWAESGLPLEGSRATPETAR